VAEKEAENTQARLRAHVKSEVELTERKKHAENEKKKLLKAIKEVCRHPDTGERQTQSANTSLVYRAIAPSRKQSMLSGTMARRSKKRKRNSHGLRSPWRKKRRNLRKFRRDSKVRLVPRSYVPPDLIILCIDKTRGFSNQIKAKQQELQPWTAQISEKQAEIDIAASEHTTLSTKVEEVKNAGVQAKEQLEKIKAERQERVSLTKGFRGSSI
jgi:structural maintenance of chromosome 4